MVEDWHDDGGQDWDCNTLNKDAECVWEWKLYIFVLLVQIYKVKVPLKWEGWSNEQTWEKEAVSKKWQNTKLRALIIFDRKAIVREFSHKNHDIHWTVHFPAAVVKSKLLIQVHKSLEVDYRQSDAGADYWSEEGCLMHHLDH